MPFFIGVINSEDRSGESGDLSESYEERFVNLPERVDIDAAEEHDEPPDGEHRSGDELDVVFTIHKLIVDS